MSIIRLNNGSVEVVTPFPNVSIYSGEFTTKLKDYLSAMILDFQQIITDIKTQYETDNVFKVSPGKDFKVTDANGNVVMQITEDTSTVPSKIKIKLGESIIAEDILGLNKLNITESAIFRNVIAKTGINVYNDLANGVYYEMNFDGVSYSETGISTKIFEIKNNKININGDFVASNSIKVLGTITVAGVAAIGGMEIDAINKKITFKENIVLEKGAYIYSETDGNQVATEKNMRELYNGVNTQITSMESNLSGFYSSLNISMIKFDVEGIKYRDFSANNGSGSDVNISALKTFYASKSEGIVDVVVNDNSTKNIGIKDFNINMNFDLNQLTRVSVKNIIVFGASSSGSINEKPIVIGSFGKENPDINMADFSINLSKIKTAISSAVPAGYSVPEHFYKIKISFTIEDKKDRFLSFIADIHV